MKVLKVVADSGVYYSNKEDQQNPKLPFGQGVRSYQYIEMSEEEYNAIPATEEAAKFFRGEITGQRPKE